MASPIARGIQTVGLETAIFDPRRLLKSALESSQHSLCLVVEDFPQLGAIYLACFEGPYWPHIIVLHKLKNALDETFRFICLLFLFPAISDFSPKNRRNELWVIPEPCLFYNLVVVSGGQKHEHVSAFVYILRYC